MRTGSAVVLLLLFAAGCVGHKPDTLPPDPQIAVKEPASTEPADPATEPTAPTPTAPATQEPVAKSTPPPSPEAVDKPAAPSPQEPVVTPAAPPPPVATPTAPTSPLPVAKPTPSAPSSPAPKPPAPSPGQPKPAAPAAPKAANPVAPAASKAATPTLDLDALKEEVKSTPAIGVFTKLSLKNKVDDLLDEVRDYHGGKSKLTKTDLRRAYDLLLMKVLSLLQDKDPRLASSIVASREAIWDLLADPKKFATVAG